MELNVNTVYTTVLSILNKEQRGYMTPDEFNKVATQVQLEIFERFFQDLNQYLRMPKTDEEFASRIAHVEEEIQVFEEYESASSSVTDNVYTVPLQGGVLTGIVSTGGTGYSTSTTAQATTGGSGAGCKVNTTAANGAVTSFTIGSTGSGYNVGDEITISGGGGNAKITVNSLTSGVHRLGSVYFNAVPGTPQIELVGRREYKQQLMSPLTQPSKSFPIGILKNDKVEVYPKVTTFNPARTTSVSDVKFSYIRKPKDVVWAFSIGTAGQYVYEPTATGTGVIPSAGSTQFEIDSSQQTQVILEILKYSGIIIRDPQIIQAAQQELAQEEANEKR